MAECSRSCEERAAARTGRFRIFALHLWRFVAQARRTLPDVSSSKILVELPLHDSFADGTQSILLLTGLVICRKTISTVASSSVAPQMFTMMADITMAWSILIRSPKTNLVNAHLRLHLPLVSQLHNWTKPLCPTVRTVTKKQLT